MLARLFSAIVSKGSDVRPLRCDDEGYVILLDYIMAIAQGLVPNTTLFSSFGSRTSAGAVVGFVHSSDKAASINASWFGHLENAA